MKFENYSLKEKLITYIEELQDGIFDFKRNVSKYENQYNEETKDAINEAVANIEDELEDLEYYIEDNKVDKNK